MQPPEFIIAIVAIVFGSIFGMYLIGKVFSLVKYWMDNKHNNALITDEDFLGALREFKQKTDRRLSTIEEVIDNNLTKGEKTIHIESDSQNKDKKETPKKSTGGSLRNMLNE